MQAHQVRPVQPRRPRKRVGRGDGSGSGTYSGRGMKGQNSRSGGGVRPAFEGGQLPLVKGLPTLRGFTNIFRREYQVVNLERMGTLPEEVTEVTPQVMEAHGLVKSARRPIKVLGYGEMARPLQVQASKFSQAARAKIESAGGTVQEQ